MNQREGRSRPVVLGVIGGIASGKSTVSRALVEEGAVLLDADVAVGEFLGTLEVHRELQREFGEAVIRNGEVDRPVLAARAFADADSLARLEAILHPRVQHRLTAQLDRLLDERIVPAVVLDVPLLLEKSPLKKRCDLLIFVDCPADIRRQRVEDFRGWDAEELARRETHQWSPERKRQLADVVFLNDGDVATLRQKIQEWLSSAGGLAGLPRRTPDPTGPSNERPPDSTIPDARRGDPDTG